MTLTEFTTFCIFLSALLLGSMPHLFPWWLHRMLAAVILMPMSLWTITIRVIRPCLDPSQDYSKQEVWGALSLKGWPSLTEHTHFYISRPTGSSHQSLQNARGTGRSSFIAWNRDRLPPSQNMPPVEGRAARRGHFPEATGTTSSSARSEEPSSQGESEDSSPSTPRMHHFIWLPNRKVGSFFCK